MVSKQEKCILARLAECPKGGLGLSKADASALSGSIQSWLGQLSRAQHEAGELLLIIGEIEENAKLNEGKPVDVRYVAAQRERAKRYTCGAGLLSRLLKAEKQVRALLSKFSHLSPL